MKIQSKHLYHGAALTQIVEDPRFTALNKVSDNKYGHYQVNNKTRILIKHSVYKESPWSFTLQVDDVDTFIKDIDSKQEAFLCLVCGKVTVCILNTKDFEEVIDTSENSPQRLKIEMKPKCGMKVSGSKNILKSVIPRNAFPKKLFENDT